MAPTTETLMPVVILLFGFKLPAFVLKICAQTYRPKVPWFEPTGDMLIASILPGKHGNIPFIGV